MAYSCFDFRLRSEIPLPELGSDSVEDARPLVEVRIGDIPESLSGVMDGGPHGLQVRGDEALLPVAGTARYLIRGGREILVHPHESGSARNVRLFLLGSALGILCHQRGLLPLHANAIVVNGAAVAFAGPSGAGKSTLAAHFARAGYPVLCDDVCVLSFAGGGTALAWPGLPRLKLWGDAAQAFGHDRAALDRAIEGLDKYHVPLGASAAAKPWPFRRLYVLEKAEEGEPRVTRLHGRDAMEEIMAQTYRAMYLAPLGLQVHHFRRCVALAAQAEVYRAQRRWGYEHFDEEAQWLERHLSGTGRD
ncbi:MAG TPA: hypothetical protein VF727_15760 [Allosphingosinicella sp.]|jgi:hypothetical protein